MFKIDMHIHSVLGKDSIIKPNELVSVAREAGLDAVCVTEHHDYGLSQPFDEISHQAGFPILRGLEYKAKEGHLLIYGVKMGRGGMPSQMPMQYVIDWVNTRDGVAVPAHPYQRDMFNGCLGDRLTDLNNLWAIETRNGSASELENSQANHVADQLKTGKVGGSDAHGPSGIGKAYTVFPEPVTSMTELIAALKKQNYTTESRLILKN
ncbi:MAG: PHP domain-containing protein [Deltaproteobacteria bacterium]|jgi:predicted metal-dependent phosphoesterase TrpH|nr:PHP domain-containing protein [Deltaproteobacteria bacterium]MBT4265997.1 PHP domain-containing protein [Deltaproteobacteria bacterium]MBT4644594.1 PHP domain-containing protein [Deltaproteobacteria bacterium]MBT6501574.1 PHP domain-containing protein [Deltaproteobacteria bacterium]MBT6612774.1 PHP domain-containing protein [Deltaproteobacteria bacterium]